MPPRFAALIAVLIAALALGAAAPAPGVAPARAPSAAAIPMRAQPNTPLDANARKLVADDIAAAKGRGDNPVVVVGTADLGGPRRAILVQLQSEGECGSAGCGTSVFSWEGGRWVRVVDGATGKVAVGPKRTKGRADLLSEDDHYVWTGTAYRSLNPAPALDLHPRKPRR